MNRSLCPGIRAYSSPSKGKPRNAAANLFIFLVRHDGNAVIVAAVLADAVRQHLLVALGAIHDRGESQFPIRAAAVLTSLGDFSFGKSHDYTS